MSEIWMIKKHYGDFTGLHDPAQAVAHVKVLLAEVDRLRARVHEVANEANRRGTKTESELARLRSLMADALRRHGEEMARLGNHPHTHISGYGQATAAAIIAERDEARAALAAVEQDRDRLSAELARVEPVLQAAQAWRRWFPHASSMFVPENALIAAVDAHRLSECIDETAEDIDEDLRTERPDIELAAEDTTTIQPCQPIGCDNGYHLAGCRFADIDAAARSGTEAG